VEDLQGNPAIVLEVLGQEDRRHASAADLAVDPVSVGEGATQAIQESGHGRLSYRPEGPLGSRSDIGVPAAVDADGFGGHTTLFGAVVSYPNFGGTTAEASRTRRSCACCWIMAPTRMPALDCESR
jgi:hypothetical protein